MKKLIEIKPTQILFSSTEIQRNWNDVNETFVSCNDVIKEIVKEEQGVWRITVFKQRESWFTCENKKLYLLRVLQHMEKVDTVIGTVVKTPFRDDPYAFQRSDKIAFVCGTETLPYAFGGSSDESEIRDVTEHYNSAFEPDEPEEEENDPEVKINNTGIERKIQAFENESTSSGSESDDDQTYENYALEHNSLDPTALQEGGRSMSLPTPEISRRANNKRAKSYRPPTEQNREFEFNKTRTLLASNLALQPKQDLLEQKRKQRDEKRSRDFEEPVVTIPPKPTTRKSKLTEKETPVAVQPKPRKGRKKKGSKMPSAMEMTTPLGQSPMQTIEEYNGGMQQTAIDEYSQMENYYEAIEPKRNIGETPYNGSNNDEAEVQSDDGKKKESTSKAKEIFCCLCLCLAKLAVNVAGDAIGEATGGVVNSEMVEGAVGFVVSQAGEKVVEKTAEKVNESRQI